MFPLPETAPTSPSSPSSAVADGTVQGKSTVMFGRSGRRLSGFGIRWRRRSAREWRAKRRGRNGFGRGTCPRAEERPRILADNFRAWLLAKIAAKPEVTLRGRWRSKLQVGLSGILCKQPP